MSCDFSFQLETLSWGIRKPSMTVFFLSPKLPDLFFKVLTLFQRLYNVILTSCVYWVAHARTIGKRNINFGIYQSFIKTLLWIISVPEISQWITQNPSGKASPSLIIFQFCFRTKWGVFIWSISPHPGLKRLNIISKFSKYLPTFVCLICCFFFWAFCTLFNRC